MVFLEINHRPDRLGANLTWYIMQIIWCHKNEWFCHWIPGPFDDSLFVETIIIYLNKYNYDLGEKIESHEHGWKVDFLEFTQQDWPGNAMKVTKEVGVDLLTYYKNNIYIPMTEIFTSIFISHPKCKSIDIDFKNTIALHLRLDDVSIRGPYPSRAGCKYYRHKLNSGNIHIDLQDESEYFYRVGLYCPGWNRDYNPFDCQAPIEVRHIKTYIEIAENMFPRHNLVIVTSPTSKVDEELKKYRIITNDDPDIDLYILSQANVIITSKSLFCFSSLFFGNHQMKFIPIWGHIIGTGITTKYDFQNNNVYLSD